MMHRAGFLLLAARIICAQTAVIEGVVTNTVTHEPISGVSVELTAVNAKDAAYKAVSDSAGAFRIPGVMPGKYHASYDADRFESPDDDPADRPIDATAGDKVTLSEELVPLGTVRGRVLDGEGRPVANITVEWLTSCTRQVRYTVNTDAEGGFAIDHLSPGSYVMRAVANRPARIGKVVSLEDLMKPAADAAVSRRPLYAPVYYPNSSDRMQASTIAIRGGEDLAGFEIRMSHAVMYRVRGVVRGESGRIMAGIAVKLRSADAWYMSNDFPPDAQVLSASDGSFDFPTVAAGEWQLSAESRRGEATLAGYVAVTVTRHDLDVLELRLVAPFSLTGTVERIDSSGGAASVTAARVVLFPVERPRDQEAMGHSTENGSVRINHVYPGRYRIVTYKRVPGYYLASVRLGEGEVLGQEVELAPGSPPLRIVYRADGGSVRGTVQNGAGATVALLPTDPALLNPAFIRLEKCDSAGRFEVDGLRPGSYYALAFDRAEFDPLQNAAFVSSLTARANGVRVGPNEVAPLDLKLTAWPQ